MKQTDQRTSKPTIMLSHDTSDQSEHPYLIQCVCIEGHEHWSKYLFCVALHGRLDLREDGGGYKVTLLVSRHFHVTPIQGKLLVCAHSVCVCVCVCVCGVCVCVECVWCAWEWEGAGKKGRDKY